MANIIALIPFISKILFPLIDAWVKKNDKDGKMLESYYSFLKEVDKSGAAKVQNYLQSEDALLKKQNELKQQLEKNGGK